MSPPVVDRRLADACQSSVHVLTPQMHIPISNETPSANALQRVDTCCCNQTHEVKVLVAVSPSTEDPSFSSPRLAVCHLQEGTCVARRMTDVSIQPITDSLSSRPNTLRRMSPEAAVTTNVPHTTWEPTIYFQFQRSRASCPAGCHRYPPAMPSRKKPFDSAWPWNTSVNTSQSTPL